MTEPKTWPEYARLLKAALGGLHVDARDVARRMRRGPVPAKYLGLYTLSGARVG